MCWIPMSLGVLMVGGGAYLIVRFYRGRGAQAPEVASPTRVETLLVGALLTSVGTLVFLLGLTGALCRFFGVTV